MPTKGITPTTPPVRRSRRGRGNRNSLTSILQRVQLCPHGKTCTKCHWFFLTSQGTRYESAHATARWKGKQYPVNRLVWEALHKIKLNPKTLLIRQCAMAGCINPAHGVKSKSTKGLLGHRKARSQVDETLLAQLYQEATTMPRAAVCAKHDLSYSWLSRLLRRYAIQHSLPLRPAPPSPEEETLIA